MSKLNGGDILTEIFQKDVRQGQFLQRILNGINQLSSAIGADPIGQTPAPVSPNGITVKASGEMVHVAVNDNAETDRSVNYLTEYADNPSFNAPWVIHHGVSRNHTMTLPTKNDSGVNHNWYFRSYKQRVGGPPSDPITFGGSSTPTAITLSGSTQLTLPPSNGSGTASNTGVQGAQGFGRYPTRPASGPKRQVGTAS